jgi:serine/threonine protein kinase
LPGSAVDLIRWSHEVAKASCDAPPPTPNTCHLIEAAVAMSEQDKPVVVGERYAILRELGRGGSAVVYDARDTKLGGRVAVKVMHADLSTSTSGDRFLREIRLMSDFGHANILPVLDSGLWDDRLFYVMKYVEGSESLRDRLRRQPSGLPIEDVVEIARGVCRALTYAHARHVLHRDVKPENILLVGTHPYLTDFGIAKALIPVFDGVRTTSGFVLGTQAYMSPEQEVSDPNIDGRTDVWSLCCVISEAITGLHPFHSTDAARMRSMKLTSPPESLRRHRPSTAEWLERLVEKGLRPHAADRWQSALELEHALENREHSGARSEVSSGRTPPDDSASDSRGRMLRGVLVAAAALALGVAAWRMLSSRERVFGTPPSLDPNIIAVSVSTASANPELRAVAERVSADLVRELSRVSAFTLVSSSVLAICRERPTAECETTLNAQRVGTRLEGLVDRIGDSLFVTAQLTDRGTKTTLAALALSEPTPESGVATTRLASRVSIAVRQRLGALAPHMARLLADARSATLLRNVLRERADAESLAALPGANEQQAALGALTRADDHLRQLIALHPDDASLWIERGWTALAMSERESTQRAEALALATAYVDSAFARSPEAPQAFELRGHLRLAMAESSAGERTSYDRLLCEAEADLRRAVAGNATLHRAWSALSQLLWSEGQTSEAKLAANHAMENDAYLQGAREGFLNLFYAQLFLENFDAARKVCLNGRDLWPNDYKFLECQLTLMLYHRAARQDPELAAGFVRDMNRLDSPEKARAMGNEYRALYRDVVVAIVATRRGNRAYARQTLERVRAHIAQSASSTLRHDFSPQEAILLWELGEASEARVVLVDWLKHRTDEVSNFRQDPIWRRLELRDDVLRAAELPLTTALRCNP